MKIRVLDHEMYTNLYVMSIKSMECRTKDKEKFFKKKSPWLCEVERNAVCWVEEKIKNVRKKARRK